MTSIQELEKELLSERREQERRRQREEHLSRFGNAERSNLNRLDVPVVRIELLRLGEASQQILDRCTCGDFLKRYYSSGSWYDLVKCVNCNHTPEECNCSTWTKEDYCPKCKVYTQFRARDRSDNPYMIGNHETCTVCNWTFW